MGAVSVPALFSTLTGLNSMIDVVIRSLVFSVLYHPLVGFSIPYGEYFVLVLGVTWSCRGYPPEDFHGVCRLPHVPDGRGPQRSGAIHGRAAAQLQPDIPLARLAFLRPLGCGGHDSGRVPEPQPIQGEGGQGPQPRSGLPPGELVLRPALPLHLGSCLPPPRLLLLPAPHEAVTELD